ncbi:hypothetical protein ACJIZ3_021133 [Penstemon smallii]|uniref:BSD2 cysteine rich domain-containing protein n=1 Tax=Penstemon smallii TaxID=265156 RepID=A0ABD3SKP3_9LAMI
MANTICFSTLISLSTKPGLVSHSYTSRKANWTRDEGHGSKNVAFDSLKVKATENTPTAKVNSILCQDCEGNGCKQCTQCEGNGTNLVDHFNGQFKAGGLCWLCRGKKEILCGKCNGAGFVGGFMSTYQD